MTVAVWELLNFRGSSVISANGGAGQAQSGTNLAGSLLLSALCF